MTLVALLAAHPALFYAQSWYRGERFLCTEEPAVRRVSAPAGITHCGEVPPPRTGGLPLAVTLASAYVRTTHDPIWMHYFWTGDLDQFGQRVFVGGVTWASGFRFQIHRHLHITDQFGVAQW